MRNEFFVGCSESDAGLLEANGHVLDRCRVEGVAPESPRFVEVYDFLNSYFGPRGEFVPADDIRRRFAISEEQLAKNNPESFRVRPFIKAVYDDHGSLVGARTHRIIVPPNSAPPNHPIVGYLTTTYVHPDHRRCGYSQLLRGPIPYQDAMDFATDLNVCNRNVVLVAEMELPDGNDEEKMRRLRSYDKGGFRALPHDKVPYVQPNLSFEDGVSEGVPLLLMIRTPDEDGRTYLNGAEIKNIVMSMYASYGDTLSTDVMRVCMESLDSYPDDDEQIPLVSPLKPYNE